MAASPIRAHESLATNPGVPSREARVFAHYLESRQHKPMTAFTYVLS